MAGDLRWTNYRSDLGNVWHIFEDSRHRIWINQGKSLMVLEGNKITDYLTLHDLGVSWITQVVEDERGNIWITSVDGGIFCLVDDYFYQYTREQGLSTSSVFGAILATDGEIYTVNNHGLNRISINPNQSEDDIISIKNYLYSDGFLGVGAYTHSMSQDTSGILWVGTYDRITAFNPAVDRKDTISPHVQMRDILVFNQAIDWSGVRDRQDSTITLDNGVPLRHYSFDGLSRWNFLPENLELSPDNNYLTFQFIGITPKNSDKVKYQYFLEGLDKRWSTIQESSEASYNNLPHGHYTFKIKAVNRDGYWSDELSYSFSIRPPWWYSTTAYIFYGLLFLFGVWLVHTYQRKRVIRIERMKAEKKEIAQAREIEKAYKELKSTQSQLIQSEKMASLGELTAGIAHEIQNPLNFINNFSEVNKELTDELITELAIGSKESIEDIVKNIRENEEKINHHGKRADSIVKNMLQHSQRSSGQKELTDINALCDEYLRLAYHGMQAKDKAFNVETELDLQPHLPKIEIIPAEIGRALLNIMNNAFYAVSKVEKPLVVVSTKALGNRIEIEVKDNGPGIPDAIRDKIFQPFFTTKPTGQGTGLGLSLSYDIVKGHGGGISLKSKEGEGSEFIIRLPVG